MRHNPRRICSHLTGPALVTLPVEKEKAMIPLDDWLVGIASLLAWVVDSNAVRRADRRNSHAGDGQTNNGVVENNNNAKSGRSFPTMACLCAVGGDDQPKIEQQPVVECDLLESTLLDRNKRIDRTTTQQECQKNLLLPRTWIT